MKVSLLKEDKIEQIVKYCMRIFEQERAECFVSSLNVIQTFQQLTIVRNLFFNNAIKAFGVLNDTTGEIEKIMIVRLADAIEYTAVIEIIISSLDSEFVGCYINELKDYFEDSYYSKVKINIIDKELDLYTEKMLIDNCFNKELEYEIDTGIFRVFTRPL